MTYTVKELRKELYSIIRRLGERLERYARNPGKDFTRKRTLTPAVLIYLILTMDEKGIWKGLLEHFQKRIDTPSASAFVQQRHGWNLFHIHELYDLENSIYTDIIVQKEHTKHESRALCQIVNVIFNSARSGMSGL